MHEKQSAVMTDSRYPLVGVDGEETLKLTVIRRKKRVMTGSSYMNRCDVLNPQPMTSIGKRNKCYGDGDEDNVGNIIYEKYRFIANEI